MAAHATPNHDYHLVRPSPWPIVGSISAFVMAVGAVLWLFVKSYIEVLSIIADTLLPK